MRTEMEPGMFDVLSAFHKRPEPFSRYTVDLLWTDEHISGRMLQTHLDPAVDLASRRPATIDATVGWMDDRLGLAGKSVTDLGCGPGLYSVRFASRGATVTGLDFSERSIGHALTLVEGRGDRLRFRTADYLKSELPADQDIVCLIYCDLCALSPDQRQLLYGRVRRALKPGGRFVCDVHSTAQFEAREEGATYGRRFMDGFWSADDYFGFLNTILYPDQKLVLDRYLIVERSRIWEVFNWLQYFDPDDLVGELSEAGFESIETVDALTGDAWTGGPREFAVIARR